MGKSLDTAQLNLTAAELAAIEADIAALELTAATTAAWTPALTFAGSGSVVLSAASGTYVRVGNVVTAKFDLTVGSLSAPSGLAQLNLPVAITASDHQGGGVALCEGWTSNAPTQLQVLGSGSGKLQLSMPTATGATFTTGADVAVSSRIRGTFSYIVN